jgi:hypothetical protein
MLICVCLRILASSRIPRYDLGRQNPSFLWWFCHTVHSLLSSDHSLSHPTIASNDNNKRKVEEEVESSTTVKKVLRLFDDDGGDDSFSESKEETEAEVETEEEEEEEETNEEEFSSEELMNQPDTSEQKLMHKHSRSSDDGDTSSMKSEPRSPRTPSRCVCTDLDVSDDTDDLWMQIDR